MSSTNEKFKANDVSTNWASIDTQVEHSGRKIILPADPSNMEYDVAIETIKRVKEQESQKFDVHEVVKGAPWDALYAVYRACQQIYGVVTNHTMKSWFRDIRPEFVTIHTGPNPEDRIQVPINQMRVPGVSEPFWLSFYGTQGASIHGTVNKKDQTRLVEIANLAREIIRTNSIYKGKAIRISVDDDGDLEMGQQPEFLDLSRVRESDMIHTDETGSLIRTNIFSPLKNTEACRMHQIPLKRGILLEGRYGTGKSLTARVTAKVAIDNGWTFLMLDRSQGLRSAIEFGRQYQPCVIFAEDIDRAADREEESVNDLVNLIDGVISKDMEMITVLTTNFIENIDQSLLRPGRFDAVISIHLPDADTAIKLVKQYGRDLIDPSIDLAEVGEMTAGQVPATIREVVERAKLSMLMENRGTLSLDDLKTSALGMKHHMELLKPKEKSETFKDKFVDGMIGLISEALGEESESGIIDHIDHASRVIRVHTNSVGADINKNVGKAISAGMAASEKAEETLEQSKANGAAIKKVQEAL